MFKRSRDTPRLEIWQLTEAKFPQNLVTSFRKSKALLLLSELGEDYFLDVEGGRNSSGRYSYGGTAIFMKRATE
jgi:hypothetical protein